MTPRLYQQYFIDKQDERRGLFQLVTDKFKIKSGIYPGSFVHITPAFYIPEMAFVDSDRRINRFFRDEITFKYIEENKTYDGPPNIYWNQLDYSSINDLQENYYEIMFSFYAGFISQACKKYLVLGGILIANNSHGDATMAIADPDYKVIGVVTRNLDRFNIRTEKIEEYITKKDGSEIDVEKVQKRMIGEKFSNNAYAYVFRKIK